MKLLIYFYLFVTKEKNKQTYKNIGTLENPELILPNIFP